MTEREVICECGVRFTSTSPRARFHSPACRKRASREGRVSPVYPAQLVVPVASEGTAVASATRAELEEAGRMSTSLGASALALAGRIDTGLDTGSALASAVKALQQTLTLALDGSRVKASPLDELKARRDRARGA